MKLNVSVVITILNEEKTLEALLSALSEQTYPASEIVLIEGGSTDKSRAVIAQFQKDHLKVPIIVHLAPGTNRSQARNIGIKKANFDIIAVTDAGCVPKPNWLYELIQPFSHDQAADVVAGFYDPAPKNNFEQVLANFTSTRDWQFDEKTYLPSSRSIAFSRKIWQKVGGYPEELETCEDLIFAEKLKAHAKQWYVNKKAQVIWPQPKTARELQDKIFHYALGDLQAGYERHIQKIRSAMWRLIVLIVVAFPLFFASWTWLRMIGFGFVALYIVGTWLKHRQILRHPSAFVYTIYLQILVDFSLVQAFIYHHIHKSNK